MSDTRINTMITAIKERIGFISKKQKTEHLLQVLADELRKCHM
jgi:hypothetical protein